MNETFYFVIIAPTYPTDYEYCEWAFSHLDVKFNGEEIGSWANNWAENYQLAIL